MNTKKQNLWKTNTVVDTGSADSEYLYYPLDVEGVTLAGSLDVDGITLEDITQHNFCITLLLLLLVLSMKKKLKNVKKNQLISRILTLIYRSNTDMHSKSPIESGLVPQGIPIRSKVSRLKPY